MRSLLALETAASRLTLINNTYRMWLWGESKVNPTNTDGIKNLAAAVSGERTTNRERTYARSMLNEILPTLLYKILKLKHSKCKIFQTEQWKRTTF